MEIYYLEDVILLSIWEKKTIIAESFCFGGYRLDVRFFLHVFLKRNFGKDLSTAHLFSEEKNSI